MAASQYPISLSVRTLPTESRAGSAETSSSFSSELTVPPPQLPIPVAWHGAAEGAEVHASSPHAVASHDSFPLLGLRLAAPMGNELFIPKSESQGSEGNPLRGK